MKKWSSQFRQLCREAWKKKIQDFNGVWTRDLAITVLQSLFFILFSYYFATHNELQAVLKW